MTKLIILDFDGTLADTQELIVRTNQEAIRRMHFPVADEASIVATIGLPLKEGILALFPDLPPEQIPAWVQMYRDVFAVLKDQMVPDLFPEVEPTLASLYNSGCTLTVASSRGVESLNGFLREMGIARYFSYVLGAEDVTRAKPFPDPVLKTLRDLSAEPSQALVVGDMPVDIQMGKSAGVQACGVTYGNSNREALLAAGADAVIDSFGALLPVVQALPDLRDGQWK